MTRHAAGTLEALAEVIANTVKGVTPAKPLLRVVCTPTPTLFDSITRDCMYKRIRWLRDAYHLQFLIDQATFNRPNIESLEDADLSQLLRDMERARECAVDGISYDDAGLVCNHADDFPAHW